VVDFYNAPEPTWGVDVIRRRYLLRQRRMSEQTPDDVVQWQRHDTEDLIAVASRTETSLQTVSHSHPPQHFYIVMYLKLMIKDEHVCSPAKHPSLYHCITAIKHFLYQQLETAGFLSFISDMHH